MSIQIFVGKRGRLDVIGMRGEHTTRPSFHVLQEGVQDLAAVSIEVE